MQVTVHYTTQLKAALGKAQESIDLPPDSSLPDLLQRLEQRHADAFRQFVRTPAGTLLPSILVCVNDQQVDPASAEPLPDGAAVTLLSAISGG